MVLGGKDERVVTGWDHLARACQRELPYKLIVDEGDGFPKDLGRYDLVYVAGRGKFKTSAAAVKSLNAYFDEGKALIIEALDTETQESLGFKPINLNIKGANHSPPLYLDYFIILSAQTLKIFLNFLKGFFHAFEFFLFVSHG